MSWKRQKEFIERYIKFAREAAWGGSLASGIPGVDTPPAPAPAPAAAEDDEDGPPQPMNRKQRRMQERETKKEEGRGAGKKGRKAKSLSASASTSRDPSAAPTGARKRVVAENGKVLVVDSLGDVYLEGEDEDGTVQEFLLDVRVSPPYPCSMLMNEVALSVTQNANPPLFFTAQRARAANCQGYGHCPSAPLDRQLHRRAIATQVWLRRGRDCCRCCGLRVGRAPGHPQHGLCRRGLRDPQQEHGLTQGEGYGIGPAAGRQGQEEERSQVEVLCGVEVDGIYGGGEEENLR